MTDDINITREDGDTGGRYVARLPGLEAEAELTYSRVSASLIIADHTGVPDAMGGRGVGVALVKRLVADAEAQGFRIVPLCPFVKAQMEKHPEWAHLFKVKYS